ncbi:MAG TPA: glycosyltransferase family 1 protein [Microbacteriaceae bacterium]|nr:glycosyltransferase family 1 protein [Microbacteriaceae bacterium]
MTTLRVIVDQLVDDTRGGMGRYAEELTRQLIATAPAGCDVEGIVSLVPPQALDALGRRLPGLAHLHRAPLNRRELSLAWQYGISVPIGRGLIHSPGLLAPLRKRDRLSEGDQLTVTIHDVVPWTHPESMSPYSVHWHKSMAKRATKFADAVVVPTHAVAGQLAEVLDFGDRIRVIGGAPASSLRLPLDEADRADRLNLPDRYILTMGTIDPRKGLGALIEALPMPEVGGLPLLIAGPDRRGDVSATGAAAAAGLPEDRVRALGILSDEDLAVVLRRATVFVYPSLAEGFGLPIVEAFQFGTPVIHSDDPALVEVGGGAGLIVERDYAAGYPERLAAAISRVITDRALSDRLRVQATDRARAFSWRDSAERVWQLHADL